MKLRTSRLPPQRAAWGFANSPAGKLVIGLTDKGDICRVAFLCGRKASAEIAAWRKQWPQTEFYRESKPLNLADNPILLIGTSFQCAVWRAIAKIPSGHTRTYAAIARRIGKASAVRAVGQACGANPVPFFVPCHRVTAANGLGGFSGGLKIKKVLLAAETYDPSNHKNPRHSAKLKGGKDTITPPASRNRFEGPSKHKPDPPKHSSPALIK